eukprot:gene2628-823_t
MMKVIFVLIVLLLRIELAKVKSQGVIDDQGKLTGYSCEKTQPVTEKLTTDELWLKSAQLIAFCIDEFGTSPDGLDQLCLTGNCTSGPTSVAACKAGCSFYLKINGYNTSGTVNVSMENATSTALDTSIKNTNYTYMDVAWSKQKSTSTIVYVIFSRIHYPDRGEVGKFIPINMALTNKTRITSGKICKYFFREYLHRVIQFSYKVIPVSKDGFNEAPSTISTVSFKPKGFKQADFIDKVTVISPTLKEGTKGFTIDYKVNWTVNRDLFPFVTGIQVSDHISENCSSGSIHHPVTVDKNVYTNDQPVSLKDSRRRDCVFEFRVVPITNCLEGVTKRTFVYYPALPPANSIILKEVFICTSKTNCSESGNSTCNTCNSGVYNVTVKLDIQNKDNLSVTNIHCWLSAVTKFPFSEVYFPLLKKEILLPSQTEYTLQNLDVDTDYFFKVFAETPGVVIPLPSEEPGLRFKTKGIPLPLTTMTPVVTTSHKKSSTTKKDGTSTSPSPFEEITAATKKGDNDSTGLTLGLALSLSILAIFVLLLLLYQVRRHRSKTKRMNLNSFEPVSYQTNPGDSWELCLEDIVFGEALGEGAFGKVYVATVSGIRMQFPSISCETLNSYVKMGGSSNNIRNSSITVKAAVKVLQDGYNQQQKFEFLEEIKLMKDVGQHKNIVNMLGCVTLGSPLCLVLEYMPHGDLLHYLRRSRTEILDQNAYSNHLLCMPKYIHCDPSQTKSTEYLMPPLSTSNDGAAQKDMDIEETGGQRSQDKGGVSSEDLLRFSWQIASGMEYLTKKGFVHRDLAARNVLVGPNKSCKVSDFGLTRFVYEEKVYMGRRSRKLPLKWMSIEAIMDQCFTALSDVWSFGVLLFEIVTLGGTPYPTMTGQELLRFLRAGNRMEKPENCSNEIYAVMKACWLTDPQQRPTFTDIKERFETLISEGTPYVEFDIDNKQPYYNVPSFVSLEESTGDSLSDDADEEEADWEYRFGSIHGRANSDMSANRRYTNREGVDFHALDANELEGAGFRQPIDSVGSEASTTPLADGILHSKVESVDENILQSNGDAGLKKERSYQWETDDSLKHNGVPQTPVLDDQQRKPFVVGHYVNIEPTV